MDSWPHDDPMFLVGRHKRNPIIASREQDVGHSIPALPFPSCLCQGSNCQTHLLVREKDRHVVRDKQQVDLCLRCMTERNQQETIDGHDNEFCAKHVQADKAKVGGCQRSALACYVTSLSHPGPARLSSVSAATSLTRPDNSSHLTPVLALKCPGSDSVR